MSLEEANGLTYRVDRKVPKAILPIGRFAKRFQAPIIFSFHVQTSEIIPTCPLVLLSHYLASLQKKMDAAEFASYASKSGYPSAPTIMHNHKFEQFDAFAPRSVAELTIIQMESSIREKTEWWNKIKDPDITSKWQQEIMDRLAQQAINDQTDADIEYCQKMINYAIAECQFLAEQYKEGPVRVAAVDGVFVRDDLHQKLQNKLLQGIASLRNQPAIGSSKEDRHPGTPQMVDLVHPSLYAYERGKTAILSNGGAEMT